MRAARLLLALTLAVFGCAARAQIIDQIEMPVDSNGEKEIVLRFLPDVALLRFLPERQGRTIRIYLRIIGDPTPFSALARELLTGPRAEGIPNFTVSFPEPDNSLALDFRSAVVFRVRQIRGTKTISVFVQKTHAVPKLEPAPERKLLPPAPTLPSTATPAAGGYKNSYEAKPVATIPDLLPAKPISGFQNAYEPKPVPGIPDLVLARPPVAVETPTPAPVVTPTPAPVVTHAPAPLAPAAVTLPGPAPSSAELAALAQQPDDFAPVPLAQVESVGRELLEKSRLAIAANNAAGAIRQLNHLLDLPTNASSREALELMAMAREKNRELAKAKSEYELFLKLYPVGPDAERVKSRLAQLPTIIEPPVQTTAGGLPGKSAEPSWFITGGLSQYHYQGNSHIEILTPPPPGLLTFNQQSLSLTDQNSLVTSADIMARHRSGSTDTRIVFRDTYTQNHLPNQANQGRLSAAYVEQSDPKAGYQYRVGRQSGTFGSIGMFDGAYGAYQIAPEYRLSATAGEVAQYVAAPIKHTFWGGAMEKQAKTGAPGGTLYFVQQSADSYVDRQAVGLELRYFDSNMSGFATLDYDLAFRDLNLLMLQGNYRLAGGTSFFFLTDHRKSPMLQLVNALPAATSPAPNLLPATNVAEALLNSGLSIADLRRWAADATATSHMLSAGVTHPLTPKWQIGADFGMNSMSSAAGAGSMPPQPSSGVSTTYNFQVIGSGIVMEGDTHVVNATLIDAPAYKGRNYSLNLGGSWFDYKLRIDLGLRGYQQLDKNSAATMRRISPTLRLSYKVWKDINLEAETGSERSQQTDAGGTHTDSQRKYLYMGYRWNLQ